MRCSICLSWINQRVGARRLVFGKITGSKSANLSLASVGSSRRDLATNEAGIKIGTTPAPGSFLLLSTAKRTKFALALTFLQSDLSSLRAATRLHHKERQRKALRNRSTTLAIVIPARPVFPHLLHKCTIAIGMNYNVIASPIKPPFQSPAQPSRYVRKFDNSILLENSLCGTLSRGCERLCAVI